MRVRFSTCRRGGRTRVSWQAIRPLLEKQSASLIDGSVLTAGLYFTAYNLGETVGIGGQTQTCEASAGCKRLIKRLEGAMENRTATVGAAGSNSKLDPEALRLIR